MKEILSDKIIRIEESATIKMATLARELKQKGVNVISLSLGEPDFDTPVHIVNAAKAALDAGDTKYTPVNGPLELRKAICQKLLRDNQLNYTPEEIVVSNGAKQCIYNATYALLNPGDEVIIFSPYWVSYYDIVKMNDGIPVIVHASIDQDFKVTAEQLEQAITPKTKAILYSSPCNPTGAVYDRNELEELVKVLLKHPDIYIISDEIYEYINFGSQHYSIAQFEQIKHRVILVNGMSKGYSMTGWRIGYIAAPQHIAKAITKFQSQVTSGASSFGQTASITALTAPMDATQSMTKAFHSRRDLLISELQKIEGIQVNRPNGAFYLFPNVSAFIGKSYNGINIEDTGTLAEMILEYAHVAVVGGDAFGDPQCIRLSYATSEENLRTAGERLHKFFTSMS